MIQLIPRGWCSWGLGSAFVVVLFITAFSKWQGIRTQDFFAWSLDVVSQHRRSAQALIGLGTGRSPSSSGCSPSAQTLLSRAQSRSSTLPSEVIMHFLTRPSCRGPLVKFRRRFSGCPVPGGMYRGYTKSLIGGKGIGLRRRSLNYRTVM